MAFTDGTITIGTSVDVGGINTGLNKIKKSFNKLGGLAAATLGVGALVKFGKAALDTASDVQEVQNVVDVSFENMAYKVEDFTSICIEKFGMSELAAKQTAGSFMAMGKSMNLSMEEASDMSIRLTALTGDMASFYNISQDYARVALSAVYTGETETLKRYGIILTEANLQQYAQTLGIEQSVKKMNARDKAILRYKYIMEATKDMEDDFVRTQDSWANQTRVLQEQWKQFLIALGDGLIVVLTPMIKILNLIVAKLIVLAKLLWIIIGNIFGIDFDAGKDGMNGYAEATEDAANAEGDLADGIGSATKAMKKMLAPFDELNVLTENQGKGSGGALDNILDLGDIDLDKYKGVKDFLDISSEIDNLFDWGKSIGETIANSLDKINWNAIYLKFRYFGTGLADFLNGLISTDLFSKVGKTIASALNSAIYAAMNFGYRFDWTQFGKKLADGINTFFSTFDFKAFATTINLWVKGLFTALKEALGNIDWKLVFSKIYEFFSNLDPETLALIAGFLLLKKLISRSLTKALLQGIAEGVGLRSISSVVASLGKSIGNAFKNPTFLLTIFNNIKTGLSNVFTNVKTYIATKCSEIANYFTTTFASDFATFRGLLLGGNGLKESMEMAFGTVATTIAGIVSLIGGLALAVVEFISQWENGWNVIKSILEMIGLILAAIGAVLLGAEVGIAALVAGLIYLASQLAIIIHDNWDTISNWFLTTVAWIKTNIFDKVVTFFTSMWKTVTTKLSAGVSFIRDNIITPIVNFFVGLATRIQQIAEGLWILLKLGFITAISVFKTLVIDPIVTYVTNTCNNIKTLFGLLWDGIKLIWGTVANWFNENVVKKTIEFFAPIVKAVGGFFSELWEGIKKIWYVFSDNIKLHVITPFVNAWKDGIALIKNAFDGLWEGIKTGVKLAMNIMLSRVESTINFLIKAINKFIGGFNDLVAKAAVVTGDKWGGVDLIKTISIPRLAQGAVIPPNKEFLAVLGDQNRGTNIEAPLDTIKQAFADVMAQYYKTMALMGNGSGEGDIVIQIDGREVFRAVRNQNKVFKKSTGISAFV